MNIDDYINSLDNFLSLRCKLVRVVANRENVITVTVSRGVSPSEVEKYIKEFALQHKASDMPRIRVEEGAELREFLGRIDEHPHSKLIHEDWLRVGMRAETRRIPAITGLSVLLLEGLDWRLRVDATSSAKQLLRWLATIMSSVVVMLAKRANNYGWQV